jgi:hypothetical protein
MKVYSGKIGPVEYFRFMGFLTFAIPYAWSLPRFWPVCIVASLIGLWFLDKVVKKEEQALREAKHDDPRIRKVVLIAGGLMFANALLLRYLP